MRARSPLFSFVLGSEIILYPVKEKDPVAGNSVSCRRIMSRSSVFAMAWSKAALFRTPLTFQWSILTLSLVGVLSIMGGGF